MCIGLIILLSFSSVALLAPLLTEPNRPDPYQLKRDWAHVLAKPGSFGHPLGTDDRGSDIYYGIIWGARISIKYGILIAVTQTLLGAVLGLLAGYYSGYVDLVLMRVTDLFLSLPRLILAMALATVFGISLNSIALALVLTGWTRPARLTRSAVINAKLEGYIEAARALGASHTRIILRHIFPNTLSPLLVQATLDLGTIILSISGLAFIGLAPAGTTEWGSMIANAQSRLIGGYWWPALFPGLAIFLFVLGANLVGDGVRDILDPRLRGS
jgi:peptide/nickel transport system permease protein